MTEVGFGVKGGESRGALLKYQSGKTNGAGKTRAVEMNLSADQYLRISGSSYGA
jgi:hypothetical protein